MRAILAERNFPVSRDPLLRLGPVGGHHVAVEGHARSPSRTPRPPTRPASTSPCSPPAPRRRGSWRRSSPPPGSIVIDNSSAWRMDPDVPLVVSEVNPRRDRQRPQGHHRQPELHHHGGDAGAQAAARRSRARPPRRRTYQAVSGAGLAGVDELDKQAREVVDRARELTHDGAAVAFPAPTKFAKPIAFNVLPLAGKLVDDGLVRDRRGAEAAQREPQDPRHPRPAGQRHVRAGAGVHRPLAVASTPSSPGRSRVERATRGARRGAGRRAQRHPDAARGRRPGPELRRSHPPGPRRVDGGRGLALFVSNDNLRKGAALNAVQIAELLVR